MSSNFFKPTRRDVVRAGAGLLVMAPQAVRAQAADAVRFSLEFRIYGGNAPLFLGAERGIFRDRWSSSPRAIRKRRRGSS